MKEEQEHKHKQTQTKNHSKKKKERERQKEERNERVVWNLSHFPHCDCLGLWLYFTNVLFVIFIIFVLILVIILIIFINILVFVVFVVVVYPSLLVIRGRERGRNEGDRQKIVLLVENLS